MSADSLFSAEKLRLIEYKIIKGQVDTPEDFDVEKVSQYHLENSLQLSFNLDKKLIKSDFSVVIKTGSKDGNKQEASSEFHFVYIFKVDNLDELAVPDKNGPIMLDSFLGNALSSITYSTSRGVLLTRLQGTAFNGFILPVINPNKLLHTN
jgi:hypothetical protein